MQPKVLILVNRLKDDAVQALDAVLEVIQKHASLVDTIDAINPASLPNRGEVELAISLGGDGTILRAAHHCLTMDCPLLGVNSGKVGFMAGYELDSFLANAQMILSQSTPLSTRLVHPITAIHIDQNGNESKPLIALNEFVITAGPPYGIVNIDISIDNNPGPTVAGDGIIVSTPLGSTAYNVSSGGPIVAPGVNATIITPNAAHSLSFRPIVVPNDSEVRLVARRVNAENGDGTRLLIDGQPGPKIESGDHIVITRHKHPVSFVIDPTVSYWNTLIRKMHWAKSPAGTDTTSE